MEKEGIIDRIGPFRLSRGNLHVGWLKINFVSLISLTCDKSHPGQAQACTRLHSTDVGFLFAHSAQPRTLLYDGLCWFFFFSSSRSLVEFTSLCILLCSHLKIFNRHYNGHQCTAYTLIWFCTHMRLI